MTDSICIKCHHKMIYHQVYDLERDMYLTPEEIPPGIICKGKQSVDGDTESCACQVFRDGYDLTGDSNIQGALKST